MSWAVEIPAEDTSIKSIPRALSSRQSSTLWSISQPPSIQSVAEIRTAKACELGTINRSSLAISQSNLIRFSNEPPYSSVRLFEIGDKNSWSK